MAKKKSGIDKAIEALEAKRAVLDLAISELKAEQAKKPAPKRAKPAAVAAAEPDLLKRA